MVEEQVQPHQHFGYNNPLQTDNYVIVVSRCRICDEFLQAKTYAKSMQEEPKPIKEENQQ